MSSIDLWICAILSMARGGMLSYAVELHWNGTVHPAATDYGLAASISCK